VGLIFETQKLLLLEVKSNGTGTMGLAQKTALHIQHAVYYQANVSLTDFEHRRLQPGKFFTDTSTLSARSVVRSSLCRRMIS
jgi:hypothetical protein